MNVEKILAQLGGAAKVRRLIGSSPSNMSQMKARGKIADNLVRFFIALHPELDWPNLLEDDLSRFSATINLQSLRRLRASRLRSIGVRDLDVELDAETPE